MANNELMKEQFNNNDSGSDASEDGADGVETEDLVLAGVILVAIVAVAVMVVMTVDDSDDELKDPFATVEQAHHDEGRLEFDDPENSFRRPESRIEQIEQQQRDRLSAKFDPDQVSERDFEPEQLERQHYEELAREITGDGRPDSIREALPDEMKGFNTEGIEDNAAAIRQGDLGRYMDQNEVFSDEVRREVDVDEVRRQQGIK